MSPLVIGIGVACLVVGEAYAVLLAIAGRFLARRRRWTFCIVVAALSCLVFPLGTALGVFTIVVLSKEGVRQAFEAGAAVSRAPSA